MNSVALAKFRALQDRGFRRCGSLLAVKDEPDRMVAVTDHGKVVWFNPEIIDGLARDWASSLADQLETAAAVGAGLGLPSTAIDLLKEAAGEITILEMALHGATGMLVGHAEMAGVVEALVGFLRDRAEYELKRRDAARKNNRPEAAQMYLDRAQSLSEAADAFLAHMFKPKEGKADG